MADSFSMWPLQGSQLLPFHETVLSGADAHVFIFRLHPSNEGSVGCCSSKRFDEAAFAQELHLAIHRLLSDRWAALSQVYSSRVYADLDCLPPLGSSETERENRMRYLCSCTMFVPVITWGTEDSLLDELTMLSNERDKESSFLASVLAAFYLLNKGIGRLKAIVPILRDESCGRVSITEVCRNLSKTSSLINCHKASLLLLEGGVRKDQSMIVEYLASFSVQEVILSLLPVHWRVAAGLKTSDMGVSKDIQGGHSMFMMGENDIKTSAYEAGQAVTTILLELMDVYVRRKMWEFSSHNFRGIELLQMFKEAGVDDVFFENFALKSFDSFVRLNSSPLVSRTRPEEAEFLSCETLNLKGDEQYQRNVDTLNMLVERFKDDERLLPLDTRLRRYRDTEVDGILALRTTNSLETAQLKLPAQRGIFCLLCVQLTFALNQIKLTVNLDLVWMRDPVCVIATPKIVSVPSLLNVVLGFLWCFLLGTAVVVDKFGTPFQRKRVMINTIISILVGYILTFLVDIVQCSIYTGKLDRCCQGFHVFVTIAFVILFLYFAQYKQQYVWIAVFFIQGAYCIFQGLKEDDWTSYIFYFLGSICIVISCWVLIVYRINYRKTLKKLELEMLSFQGTWNQLVEGKAEVLRTLDERVGEIQAELKSKIAQRVESPLQQLVEMLELRRTRYSTRMHKITQQCQDLQQLYLEAQQVSADFQQLIATWTPVGFVWEGKLKSVARAIQKTVRSYGRDASCLTDIVRCTVVVDSIDDVLTWVEGLKRNSMVAHGIATPKNLKRRISTDARIEMDRDDFLEKKFMSITSIKNRYSMKSNFASTGGYRDLCVCVEVGWVINESGVCSFVPVEEWDTTEGVTRHICEIQVLLNEIHEVKKYLHKQYVNFRNLTCQ